MENALHRSNNIRDVVSNTPDEAEILSIAKQF
jgi:hypothetical protein